MEKPQNLLRSQTTNRQTAFKVTIRGDCIKVGTCLRKENLVFNIIYGKFCFDGDFFARNLDTSVALRLY